jgi:uncharacterized phage protein gp47/JayE
MPSAGDIVSNMVAALRVAEPNLDTSVGTPIRKILDVIGESTAEAYVDGNLINYQYDIDSKTGGDLDDFVALFGFTRIPSQRAQGVVTFTRPNDQTAATQALVIAPGTQVLAQTNPLVYVQTITSGVMDAGITTIDIPVQAVSSGVNGNVPAGLLTTLVQSAPGITSVTNAQALSGGTAQESDDQLRARFKQTVFRSLAGTAAMYQAVAQEVPQDVNVPTSRAVSSVNVIGASSRYREQIQIVGGTATSTLPNAAYIYSDNNFCGPDIDNGVMLTPNVDYHLTITNPTNGTNATCVIVSNNSTTMPDGIYDFDLEYVSQSSRNDPANTRFGQGAINNRIDVYCNGTVTDTATQSVVFSNALTFNTTSSSPYYNQLYSMGSPSTPVPPNGYVFIPLAFGPLLTLPATINISGTVYTYQTDYFIVQQEGPFGHSIKSRYGIAWNPAHMPANGATFSLTYNYNRVGRDVQEAINNWRLVGTDALAHTGIPIPLKFNFAIVYDKRFDITAVNTAIDTALSSFISSLGFFQQLQVSDVLNVVHNVAGVDNVRFLTSTDDAVSYAICQMSAYATNTILSVYASGGRAIDVNFTDQQYPTYFGSRIIIKARNTFGQY